MNLQEIQFADIFQIVCLMDLAILEATRGNINCIFRLSIPFKAMCIAAIMGYVSPFGI